MGGPRAAAEGAPGGVSTCSQLSQLTRASHPNSLLEAATGLALCYTQTSSPLTVPIWEHHPAGAPPAWDPSACTTIVPQGFTSPPKAVGTTIFQPHQGSGHHNLPAPSQTPGEGRKRSQPPPCGGQSILLHFTRERMAQQLERAVAGSCQHPAVRSQIPWQPIRSSSWLPAGALDRGPGTNVDPPLRRWMWVEGKQGAVPQ